MTGFFARGLAAGAAGTTVLETVRHLDTVIRGRPRNWTPEGVVDAVAKASGRKLPGRGAAAESQRTALGALAGIGGGVVTGVLASAVRAAGIRLPAPVGAVAAGATAMAAADVPAAVLGVSDPSTWTAADWAADAVPHLAYGAAVQAVLEAIPAEGEEIVPRHPAGAGLAARSVLLGVAAGARSSLGWAAPTLTAPHRPGAPEHRGGLARVTALAAVAGEMVADKQPGVPSRTSPAGAAPRFLGAAAGAAQLATRARANAALPVAMAAGGAAAATWGGPVWRHWAAGRLPGDSAALVEDGVAVLLAALACLPGRKSRRPLRVRRVQWVEAG
jgi:uncharacterized membrane protein